MGRGAVFSSLFCFSYLGGEGGLMVTDWNMGVFDPPPALPEESRSSVVTRSRPSF